MAQQSYKYCTASGGHYICSAIRVRDEVQQDSTGKEIRVELIDYIGLTRRPTNTEFSELVKLMPLIDSRIGLCTSMTKAEFETITRIS